jgi:tetratricopeptide (TPR) repeat protein
MRQHNARILNTLLSIIFFIVSTASQGLGQELDTVALKAVVNRAVELMDRNLADEAIKRWDSALAMRPDYVLYKYERAICMVMGKRYSQAVEALKPMYRDSMLYDRAYQLLGNSYDYLDDSTASLKIYSEGLSRYPMSGRLHYEMGAAAFIRGQLDTALRWWVKGTRVEPSFATNYYWIAKTSAKTRNRIWTVFFGEAFINIETNSQRTKEIGEMLFDAWNASMSLGSDDPINFCSDQLLEEPSPFGPDVLNFPTAFEFTIAQSSQHYFPDSGVRKQLTVEQLVDVRMRFIKGWIGAGYNKKYPNDLLEWNAKLQDAGWLREYLWWVLGHGNLEEMRKYFEKNEARYDTFFGWLTNNHFPVDHPLCLGLHCSN